MEGLKLLCLEACVWLLFWKVEMWVKSTYKELGLYLCVGEKPSQ